MRCLIPARDSPRRPPRKSNEAAGVLVTSLPAAAGGPGSWAAHGKPAHLTAWDLPQRPTRGDTYTCLWVLRSACLSTWPAST